MKHRSAKYYQFPIATNRYCYVLIWHPAADKTSYVLTTPTGSTFVSLDKHCNPFTDRAFWKLLWDSEDA